MGGVHDAGHAVHTEPGARAGRNRGQSWRRWFAAPAMEDAEMIELTIASLFLFDLFWWFRR